MRFKAPAIWALAALALGAILIVSAGCAGRPTGGALSGADGPGQAAAPAPGQKGFTEVPIGDAVDMEGMSIGAVYFQPVEMEPKAGPAPEDADIHLEADIAAAKGNQVGFGVGEFVPNLTVSFQLKKQGSSEVLEGSMMPMNASDGAHYGNNVKMLGAGNYELTLTISSPEKQGYVLHTDKETGVSGRFWKKPITVSWSFPFVPRKWK